MALNEVSLNEDLAPAADRCDGPAPLAESNGGSGIPTKASNFIPCMGNFSIQYNFTSASIAVKIIGDKGYLGRAYAEEPDWSQDIAIPMVFLGAMIGMFFMGRLGDVLGRAKAMRLTLLLTMAGAAVPALAAGSGGAFFAIVCVGRLILGIGVGGIYPLSAVSSAEGQRDSTQRAYTVSVAFLWQSVGVVVPYLVALVMISFIKPEPAQDWVPSFEFRTLFALGVVPAGIVFLASLKQVSREEFRPDAQREGVLASLRKQRPATRWTLVGTTGSWFVWDVVYYGTAVFTPNILEDIFGEQTLFATCWQSVVVSLMGIPGCLLAIVLIKRWGCKCLNTVGFLALALCFAIMAVMWEDKSNTSALFGIFCVLNFFLSFGPNLGTYVLPAICFPMEVRSTCHGISATGGKMGAMTGAFLFPFISKGSLGIVGVLWMQTGASILGALISNHFLKNDWDYLNEDDKVATESFICGAAEAGARANARGNYNVTPTGSTVG